MTSAPTLEDVAREAGVSRATASRVVRGDSRVNPDRVLAVTRAVEVLGYVPNSSARALATRSTGAIALIVPEPNTRLFTDPFFGAAVSAISEQLAPTDIQLLLTVSAPDGDAERLRRFLRGGHADGLLVMSQHEGDNSVGALAEATVPTVHIGRPPQGLESLHVDVDNVAGGRRAAEHLLARGCTRPALLGGPADMSAAQDRRAGFERALSSAGMTPALVWEGDFTLSSGEAGAGAVLDQGSETVDGIFAANDLMAIGALRRLTAAGVRVPEEISIIGFDDTPLAADPINALTTVVNPVHELGTLATELLMQAMSGAHPASRVLDSAVVKTRRTA